MYVFKVFRNPLVFTVCKNKLFSIVYISDSRAAFLNSVHVSTDAASFYYVKLQSVLL